MSPDSGAGADAGPSSPAALRSIILQLAQCFGWRLDRKSMPLLQRDRETLPCFDKKALNSPHGFEKTGRLLLRHAGRVAISGSALCTQDLPLFFAGA